MKDFHLLWEELLQPFVFLNVIMNELDGKCPGNFNSTFPFFAPVEPCLRPPDYSIPIWIDTDSPLDVETLNVYLEISKRIDYTLAF